MHFQRSFSKELFDDAIACMTKANIKSDTKIKEFQALQIKVQKIVVQRAGMEEDLGDIPDDFKGKQRQHKTSETR